MNTKSSCDRGCDFALDKIFFKHCSFRTNSFSCFTHLFGIFEQMLHCVRPRWWKKTKTSQIRQTVIHLVEKSYSACDPYPCYFLRAYIVADSMYIQEYLHWEGDICLVGLSKRILNLNKLNGFAMKEKAIKTINRCGYFILQRRCEQIMRRKTFLMNFEIYSFLSSSDFYDNKLWLWSSLWFLWFQISVHSIRIWIVENDNEPTVRFWAHQCSSKAKKEQNLPGKWQSWKLNRFTKWKICQNPGTPYQISARPHFWYELRINPLNLTSSLICKPNKIALASVRAWWFPPIMRINWKHSAALMKSIREAHKF